jgi:hypothetical protein
MMPEVSVSHVVTTVDKHEVLYLSDLISVDTTEKAVERGMEKIKIPHPTAVANYTCNMKGVELSDSSV